MKKIIAVLLGLSVMLSMATGAFALQGKEANTENVKNIVKDSVTYINPVYEDFVSEEDLVGFEDIKKPDATVSSNPVYMNSVEEIGESMREQLKARENPVVIYYVGEDYNQQLFHDFMNEAVKHTGEPDEGAYIEYNYIAWSAGMDGYTQGSNYYLTFYYDMTYCSDAKQEKAVDEAVDSVLESLELEGLSHYEKVVEIYDYICENVVYDYENLNDDSYILKFGTYAALINKTAVCQGYATLFYRLAMECGIETRVITGWETTSGVGHAWNIVRLADKYYNLDSTWDAGYYDHAYFLKCDDNFFYHARDERYACEEFYAECEMSEKDYGYSDEDKIFAEGWCGNEKDGHNLEWHLYSDGALEITGEGEMMNYSESHYAPWHEYVEKVEKVILSHEMTSIGNCAFLDCRNLHGGIDISSEIKNIGENAFHNCGLDDYYFEGDAPSVADSAFDSENDVIHYHSGTSGWDVDENGDWHGIHAVNDDEDDEAEIIVYGDLTGDGKITIIDANLVRRAAAKLITLDANQFKAADVNGDGKITIIDANLVRRYAAKLITSFPAESK